MERRRIVRNVAAAAMSTSLNLPNAKIAKEADELLI